MKELMQEDGGAGHERINAGRQNVYDRLKEVSTSEEVLGMKMLIEKDTQIYGKLQGGAKAGRRECMAD